MAPSSGSGVLIEEPSTPDEVLVESAPQSSVRIGVGLWILIAIPFAVALVALAQPRWFPVLDLAQTELRIRDVWSAQPPLVGLPGRIGNLANQGSHPGPLSFWALWPVYALFGKTSWAMQVSVTTINLVAVGLVLWMARRRGGVAMLLAMGAVVALLVRFYGPEILTQPWNPYMPVMWWLVFVVAVWSILCDDFVVLPVGVFAAMFCLQTHISYAGLVVGLAALAVASMIRSAYLRRGDTEFRRRLLRWSLGSLALALVLFLPPIVQQLTGSRGNLAIIWSHFTDPPEDPIGLREGLRILLVHLNPWRLIAQQDGMRGSVAPGALFVLVWLTSTAFAYRMKQRVLGRLDVVLAVALVLAVFSASNIFGYLWFYLVLWSWSINALMMLAVGWTVVAYAAPRLGADRRVQLARAGAAALVAITVLTVVGFTIDSAAVESPDARVSKTLGELLRPTMRAINEGAVPGGGPDGRYQVTWVDPVNIGGPGYGLLNELEREGFDVGVPPVYSTIVTPERITRAEDADAVVHLAVGQDDIDRWRARPDTVEVAFSEPRTPKEQAEYERLERRVVRELEAAGLSEIAAIIDDNVFMAAVHPDLPEQLRAPLERMVHLGKPSAIFVGPPGEDPVVRT